MCIAFVAAFVLPSIAASQPGYVNDVLAVATGGTATGDIGLMRTVIQVAGLRLPGRRPLFGIALFRARVLARWAAALLAVGAVATVALAAAAASLPPAVRHSRTASP